MHKAIGLQVRGTPFMSTMFSNGAPKNGGDALVQGPASANRQFNNQSVGWFEVVAQDWNEPGRGADKFAIVLLTAQTNGTELYRMNLPAAASIAADASLTTALDGGNIQYHHCK
jgi:hypothetical protein